MATSWARAKFWWGTVELYHTDEAAYEGALTATLGSSAREPNTAARRCHLMFSRTPGTYTEDVAICTMDFLNLTGGAPDDTWSAADFAAIESAITVWWNAIKAHWRAETKLDGIRWYRVGPGIVPPNPMVRYLDLELPGTSSGAQLPPQVAVSVTEKTGVRKSWGRFYLPAPNVNLCGTSNGRLAGGLPALLADATKTLYETTSAADLIPVVFSKTRQKLYSVEKIQVDDIWDVIRSRRWSRPITREVRPV